MSWKKDGSRHSLSKKGIKSSDGFFAEEPKKGPFAKPVGKIQKVMKQEPDSRLSLDRDRNFPRRALPPGIRVMPDGSTYKEVRENRSDTDFDKPIKLEPQKMMDIDQDVRNAAQPMRSGRSKRELAIKEGAERALHRNGLFIEDMRPKETIDVIEDTPRTIGLSKELMVDWILVHDNIKPTTRKAIMKKYGRKINENDVFNLVNKMSLQSPTGGVNQKKLYMEAKKYGFDKDDFEWLVNDMVGYDKLTLNDDLELVISKDVNK